MPGILCVIGVFCGTLSYVKDIQASLGTRKHWPVELQPENLCSENDSQQSHGTHCCTFKWPWQCSSHPMESVLRW